MTKSRFFIVAAICFAAGILVQSHTVVPWRIVIAGLAIAIVWIALFTSTKLALAKQIGWWGLVMILGMMRMHSAVQGNEYQALLNSKQQFDAVVIADVDVRTDRQLLTVQPKGHSQNILITLKKYDHYAYGDWLLITGKLTEPKASEDFDYKAYLLRWSTYALMSYPQVIVLKHDQGHWWMRALFGLKYAFVRQVNMVLPDVESNLLLGILIGARKGLPDEVINNFNATGVSHVIAISGYNISILAASLGFLDRKIGRRVNFWLTLVIIVAFVLMSGASASVIRAGLMGALVLLSARVGRLYAITPSLCAAAAVMLLFNPRILYWDASFQLSFLATIGVVYISPLLEQLTTSWPSLLGIKSNLLTTMSAIITTLPFMLYQFGRLSLVAPVVNIIILPFVPTTMLFGFLTGLPIIGFGFGLIAHWLLLYMLVTTSWFAHLKYASTEVHFNQLWFALSYTALIALYILAKLGLKKHQSRSLPEPSSVLQ